MAKITTAANFMRSATPPRTRAAVMQAKVIWKAMKTSSGMTTPVEKVATVLAGVTSFRKSLPPPPMNLSRPPPSEKDRL